MSSRYDNLLANVPTDLWIGGKWRKSSDGGRFDVLDPATEAKIASVASATIEDAKTAVDAASDAFAGWAGRKPRERAEVLRKSFELIMRDAERLAKLITIENGKALSDSRGEVAYAEFFRWYAEKRCARSAVWGVPVPRPHRRAAQACGHAVLVTPWNFPAPWPIARSAGACRRLPGRARFPGHAAWPCWRLPIQKRGRRAGGGGTSFPRHRERWWARCCTIRACASFLYWLDDRSPQALHEAADTVVAGERSSAERALHRVRGCRHRRGGRRYDRQDAQHGRGPHRPTASTPHEGA
jgi:hypothetical protein